MSDNEPTPETFIMERLSLTKDELIDAIEGARIIRRRREGLARVRAERVQQPCASSKRMRTRNRLMVPRILSIPGWLQNFLGKHQLAGVAIATASLVAWAFFWVAFFLSGASPASAVGLFFLFFAGLLNVAYLRFKVPYVLEQKEHVSLAPGAVEDFQLRLRAAWPDGRPDLRAERTETLETLRAALIEELASMEYYEAGAIVAQLLEAPESRNLSAAYALLDYIEESPFLRRVFDAVRGYADGSLYSPHASQRIAKWVEERVTELGQKAEWLAWSHEKPVIRFGKRAIDVVGAGLLLIMITFILPILPLAAILLRFETTDPPLPIIMKTLRIGRLGRPFGYFRFRARVSRTERGTVVPGLISRFLLLTGLDKAPALMNVLAGEMSLVGPHPLHWCHYQRVIRQGVPPGVWLGRLRVNPGLTGPSQITALRSPNNGFRCADYLKRDVRYAARWSLSGDLVYLAQQASESAMAGLRGIRTPPTQLLRAHTLGIRGAEKS